MSSQCLKRHWRFAGQEDHQAAAKVDYSLQSLGIPMGERTKELVTGIIMPAAVAANPSTYDSPHIRYRDYWADAASLALAVRLEPADEEPSLAMLAAALKTPMRPLFIGRKACLPSCPILLRSVDAPDTVAALAQAEFAAGANATATVFFNDVLLRSAATCSRQTAVVPLSVLETATRSFTRVPARRRLSWLRRSG